MRVPSDVEKIVMTRETVALSQPSVSLNKRVEMLRVRALKVKALITLPKNKKDMGVAMPAPMAAIAPISMRNQSSAVA